MKTILAQVASGQPLSHADALRAFEIIMSGSATDAQIGAFLMGIRVRGEHIDEITAAATIMREKANKISAPANAVDTCGTGGDGANTYNISTAAALVAAACGAVVAKHGNKAVSSKSGSADVLSSLGVNLAAPLAVVEKNIADIGIGFLMAPNHHSAMRFVGPARQQLGVRTIFNMLGPLSNPADAKRQLMGVFADTLVEPLAHVLNNLGSVHAWVVHGADGLDEITTTTKTYVAEVRDGCVRTFTIAPEDFGIARATTADLTGGDSTENAAAIRAIFTGTHNAYRDIVALNAAATLVVADVAPTLKDGLEMAFAAMDDGRAQAKLDALAAASCA
jgi:anthranilate phosphoribosyltransferase